MTAVIELFKSHW